MRPVFFKQAHINPLIKNISNKVTSVVHKSLETKVKDASKQMLVNLS